MKLVLMIDTSGSMKGEKIGSLNDVIENIIPAAEDYTVKKGEKVRVNVLLFSRNVRWLYTDFVSANEFIWRHPDCSGMTSTGVACKELAVFLNNRTNIKNLKVILITDGCPTDDFDEGFSELNEIESFQKAECYAIPIGKDADLDHLELFTSNKQHIFSVKNLDKLIKLLFPESTNHLNTTHVSSINVAANDSDWE